MLAALQRTLILVASLAALAWAAFCFHAGRVGHALDLAWLIAGCYVVVISLEFMFLAATAGSGEVSRPRRLAALYQAWKGELLASTRVFLWRQPFATNRWPDRLPPTVQGRRGVILVHGYFCNRGFWNSWTARLTAERTPFIAVTLEPVFGSIADYAPMIEQAVTDMTSATGAPPVVVAHSMGGLAVRYWWLTQAKAALPVQQGQAASRLQHLITLGTPHGGTWLARFAFTANARQMRLGSAWLKSLTQDEPAEHRKRMTCFYSDCDNIVFPSRSATLPDARNVRLEAVAHVAMANCPEPYQAMQSSLQMPETPR